MQWSQSPTLEIFRIFIHPFNILAYISAECNFIQFEVRLITICYVVRLVYAFVRVLMAMEWVVVHLGRSIRPQIWDDMHSRGAPVWVNKVSSRLRIELLSSYGHQSGRTLANALRRVDKFQNSKYIAFSGFRFIVNRCMILCHIC